MASGRRHTRRSDESRTIPSFRLTAVAAAGFAAISCGNDQLDLCARMSGVAPVTSELQAQIMAVLWRLDAGTVEQVRRALPSHCRGARTTVRTALNRLDERGFLTRERDGRAFVYRSNFTETQYLACTIQHMLAAASPDARKMVLAQLISGLSDRERADLLRLGD